MSRNSANLALVLEEQAPVCRKALIDYAALVRKLIVIFSIFGTWEIASRLINNPQLLPSVIDTLRAVGAMITVQDDTTLQAYILATCKSVLIGFPFGVVAAAVFVAIAMSSKLGDEYMDLITGAGNVLPSVFIFPIAMLVFGLSLTTKTSVIALETMFVVAISMRQGFRAVPETRINVGRNLGLSQIGLVFRILIPGAMPAILSGLRTGLGRALIVSLVLEMIAGGAVGEPGLGYFVMLANNAMKAPDIYAGILAAIAVGLCFQAVFKLIEKLTVEKFGMVK